MFGDRDPQPITGTTSPIFVPCAPNPKAVRAGKDYFLVKFYSGQVAFHGPFWQKAKQLVISSQVNLNHPSLGSEGLRAIQRARAVSKDRAEQLGLSPNLIKLVPATMPQLSISIDFLLDTENRIGQLGGLINSDSFVAAISLAPGSALVAKTIAGLSSKILQTFFPAEQRQPILQFSGDFNIASGDLMDGYYVILGTRDENNPIPDPLPKLEIRDGGLLGDGVRITGLSYIVLQVRRTEARTRDLSEGAPWDAKLRDAEGKARMAAMDGSTAEEQAAVWQDCRKLLREAQVLLDADPNYLREEGENIFQSSLKYCSDQVGGRGVRSVESSGGKPQFRQQVFDDLHSLGIDPDEKWTAKLNQYAEQVADSRAILREAGAQGQ
jgi:hypothetical protein